MAHSVSSTPRTGATKAVVNKAYRKLALESYPDKVEPAGEDTTERIQCSVRNNHGRWTSHVWRRSPFETPYEVWISQQEGRKWTT